MSTSPMNSRNKKFPCHLCDKGYNKRYNLNQHIEYHHMPDQKLTCPYPQCEGKTFKTEYNLANHNKFFHILGDKFPCNVCGKTFGRQAVLDEHMNVHSEVRPYKCPQCDTWFKASFNLRRHIRVSHNSENPAKKLEKECKDCGRRYTYGTELKLHRNDCHSPDEMEEESQDDSKPGHHLEQQSVQQQPQQPQQQLHQPQPHYQPYQTAPLNYDMSNNGHQHHPHQDNNYYHPHPGLVPPPHLHLPPPPVHLQPQQPQQPQQQPEPEPEVKKSGSSNNKSIPKRKRNTEETQCELCGIWCYSPFYFNKHMENSHGEKKFMCSHCARMFTSLDRLRRHIKSVHKIDEKIKVYEVTEEKESNANWIHQRIKDDKRFRFGRRWRPQVTASGQAAVSMFEMRRMRQQHGDWWFGGSRDLRPASKPKTKAQKKKVDWARQWMHKKMQLAQLNPSLTITSTPRDPPVKRPKPKDSNPDHEQAPSVAKLEPITEVTEGPPPSMTLESRLTGVEIKKEIHTDANTDFDEYQSQDDIPESVEDDTGLHGSPQPEEKSQEEEKEKPASSPIPLPQSLPLRPVRKPKHDDGFCSQINHLPPAPYNYKLAIIKEKLTMMPGISIDRVSPREFDHERDSSDNSDSDSDDEPEVVTVKLSSPEDQPTKSSECTNCIKRLSSTQLSKSERDLFYHVNDNGEIEEDGPCRCQSYDEIFGSEGVLSTHVDGIHLLKSHFCFKCVKKFRTKSQLELHHGRVHKKPERDDINAAVVIDFQKSDPDQTSQETNVDGNDY